MKFWFMVLSLFVLMAGSNAQAAKRLGGGKSIGQQSVKVAQSESTPMPGAAATQGPVAPAPVAPPASPPRAPWWGALAAGLGLVWLAAALGNGGAMTPWLLVAVLAVLLGSAWWYRRQRASVQPATGYQPFAFPVNALQSKPYRPENVGNDASARPWERAGASLEGPPSVIGSALLGTRNWGVPKGFDTAGFLQAAKANFIHLQAAWDRSDVAALRAMMTDSMLAEIRTQLAEREAQTPAGHSDTEVVMLDARLLGIEELGGDYLASVEYSGLMREDVSAGPSPFREVWNLTRAKTGTGGWLVAGVQALQ